MYFYLLIIPSLVVLALVLLDLYRVKKHDTVLYRFCQIRRDVMALMRKRGMSLSENDYFALKQLITTLDTTIHNYNACKYAVFHYRNLARKIEELKINVNSLKRREKTNDPEIPILFKEFDRAMIYAFLSYTPFLRSEWTLKAILMLIGLLIKIGVKKISNLPDELRWLRDQRKNGHNGGLNHA